MFSAVRVEEKCRRQGNYDRSAGLQIFDCLRVPCLSLKHVVIVAQSISKKYAKSELLYKYMIYKIK